MRAVREYLKRWTWKRWIERRRAGRGSSTPILHTSGAVRDKPDVTHTDTSVETDPDRRK